MSGEGHDEHQRSPKDKEWELYENHPSHTVPYQKGTPVNKDISSSLLLSSQKGDSIEKSSQPEIDQEGEGHWSSNTVIT